MSAVLNAYSSLIREICKLGLEVLFWYFSFVALIFKTFFYIIRVYDFPQQQSESQQNQQIDEQYDLQTSATTNKPIQKPSALNMSELQIQNSAPPKRFVDYAQTPQILEYEVPIKRPDKIRAYTLDEGNQEYSEDMSFGSFQKHQRAQMKKPMNKGIFRFIQPIDRERHKSPIASPRQLRLKSFEVGRERFNSYKFFERSHDEVEQDIIFIPSISANAEELVKIPGVALYEERFLCVMFWLQHPGLRLVYITSIPVSKSTIKYYLGLLSKRYGRPIKEYKNRLLMISCQDSQKIPLTEKVLQRPRIVQKLKDWLRPNTGQLRCFFSTNLEKEIACTLEIPLFATDWSLAYYGTKEGSRDIFRKLDIPHAVGTDLYTDIDQLAEAIKEMYDKHSNMFDQIVVKLNQSFSGEGNAILNMQNFNKDEDLLWQIKYRLCNELKFEAQTEVWESYASKIQLMGALAEGWVKNVETSPSAQGWINTQSSVEIYSTHEQILSGQVYLGCEFPAKDEYRDKLMAYTKKVGEELANQGCRDRFAVDFVCSPNEFTQEYEVYAVEINLRWGGTSHPFIEMSQMVPGSTDQVTGIYKDKISQKQKFYIATDNFKDNSILGSVPDDIIYLIEKYNQLQFDFQNNKGVIFHLIACASEIGKLGYTAVGDSREEAQKIYDKVQQTILKEFEPLNKLKSFTKLEETTIKKETQVNS